jgi:hypothetical protein
MPRLAHAFVSQCFEVEDLDAVRRAILELGGQAKDP